MRTSRIAREEALLALVDVVRSKGKTTVRDLASELSIPFNTACARRPMVNA